MSIEITVNISGLDLGELANNIPTEMVPELVEGLANVGEEIMRDKAPVRTGQLRDSIVSEVQYAGVDSEAYIFPTAPYTRYVVQGTGPHEIYPINARALSFQWIGGLRFYRHVHHPGTRANPFMEETFGELLEQVPMIWHDVWRRHEDD